VSLSETWNGTDSEGELTERSARCNVRFKMARTEAPPPRARLLDEIVDYILKRGLGNLTLRPLAAALKTSPRMLIYFFGSKEQLITEALTQCRVRQQQEFARILSTRGNRRQRLAFAWEVWSSKETERFLWLFFEIYALAMRDRKRFPGLVERLVKDWLTFLERPVAASGVEPERVSPMATFILATIQGLQLDLLATGERRRIDRAFREMLRLLSMPRPQVRDSL
jgi:AcrR family transcriptional regulator